MNKVIGILGRRGTGKTVYTKNLIKDYHFAHPTQKILILDTLEHPSYKDIPSITLEQLKLWKPNAGGIYKLYGSNTDEILTEVSKHLTNALLILEDSSKYIRRTLSNDTRKFIFDSKQKNLDIVFLFHGFMAAPSELFRIIDNLVIFKTDHPQYRKRDLPNYDDVLEAYKRVMAHKSPYHNETIEIY